MTYEILQQYWWLLVSLLGALFVFLTFVQGANSMIFSLGRDEAQRQLIINSTGRKWEFTFTTLVTFGGAFFASFPLFYSTSFGGAYWVWMLILFSFVLQAVAYEFQSKPGNLFGKNVYRWFLVLNGILGPLLVGTAVGTFFNGAEFIVSKDNMLSGEVISTWAGTLGGLEAVLNPWNLVLGFAVMFLSRTLGVLYIMNNVDDDELCSRASRRLWGTAIPFVIFFVAFVVHLLVSNGWRMGGDGVVSIEAYAYLHNFLAMPVVLVVFLLGVILVLAGIAIGMFSLNRRSERAQSSSLGLPSRKEEDEVNRSRGIWFAGIGTVLAVLTLLLVAGWNNTCYYPSLADTQSSLALSNSSSSEFTLTVMSFVSILIPFVLAYIVWAWRAIDAKNLSKQELADEEHKY